ncbi:hypothetical protein FACS189447_09190 [Spirochaetia bacterium]|nr:hypothetical protein FACS189447_09190 [Spirochaetia bacterium]
MKILIADDESFVRRGIISSMPWEELGISKIVEAEDGVQALDIAETERPDIILSDIRMPHLSGIELVEALRTRLECTVIFMSAYTDKEYLKSAIRFHAIGYVEKPIVIRELQTAIEEAVNSIRSKGAKNPPPAFPIPEEPLIPSDEKKYLELFSHALLQVSQNAVESAIDAVAGELKKGKGGESSQVGEAPVIINLKPSIAINAKAHRYDCVYCLGALP